MAMGTRIEMVGLVYSLDRVSLRNIAGSASQ